MIFNRNFFSGGVFCLDFCNTYDHRNIPAQYDFFPDHASVADWGEANGALPKKIKEKKGNAEITLEKIRSVRELIFRIFDPFTHSGIPDPSDLAALDEFLRATTTEFAIVPFGRAYRRVCIAEDPALRVVCEALRSAADLLVSGRLERIRKCPGCDWLFYDQTRNGSRKWCTMRLCGNRAKSKRHYRTVRKHRSPARH